MAGVGDEYDRRRVLYEHMAGLKIPRNFLLSWLSFCGVDIGWADAFDALGWLICLCVHVFLRRSSPFAHIPVYLYDLAPSFPWSSRIASHGGLRVASHTLSLSSTL